MGRRCKETKLLYRWDRKQNDFLFFYPRRCDGALAHNLFFAKQQHVPIANYGKTIGLDTIEYLDSFIDELKKRGYDTTTFRFEVSLKENDDDN